MRLGPPSDAIHVTGINQTRIFEGRFQSTAALHTGSDPNRDRVNASHYYLYTFVYLTLDLRPW